MGLISIGRKDVDSRVANARTDKALAPISLPRAWWVSAAPICAHARQKSRSTVGAQRHLCSATSWT